MKMTLLIDIPYEAIFAAYHEILKKRGICKHLPKARFHISDIDTQRGDRGPGHRSGFKDQPGSHH